MAIDKFVVGRSYRVCSERPGKREVDAGWCDQMDETLGKILECSDTDDSDYSGHSGELGNDCYYYSTHWVDEVVDEAVDEADPYTKVLEDLKAGRPITLPPEEPMFSMPARCLLSLDNETLGKVIRASYE